MPFLTTNDQTQIYFQDWGSGRPVVLIHGWPVSSDMWEKQATHLVEQGYRVITYDRRGFGHSDKPWQGYDYDTFASDLNIVLEACALTNATLVGFSMGGGEVIRYLAHYGTTRVSSAVLISAVTPFMLKTNDNPDGLDATVFEGMAHAIRKDRPAFMREFGAKFYGRTMLNHTVSDAALEWHQEMALQGSLRATLAAAEAWATTDFRDEMAGMVVPFLVIHGSSDATVPIDISARKSVKILPNAQLVVLEGEAHGLFLTAADTLNTELLQFLTRFAEPIPPAVQMT